VRTTTSLEEAAAAADFIFEAIVEKLPPKRELFADLDLFVLPSTEPEPYGIVVVEALASGTPVVVTDAGGAREIVDHAAADSGTLVQPRDTGALADALVDVTPGTTSPSARAARRSLQPPSAVGRFAEIFRDVAARRDRRRVHPR